MVVSSSDPASAVGYGPEVVLHFPTQMAMSDPGMEADAGLLGSPMDKGSTDAAQSVALVEPPAEAPRMLSATGAFLLLFKINWGIGYALIEQV